MASPQLALVSKCCAFNGRHALRLFLVRWVVEFEFASRGEEDRMSTSNELLEERKPANQISGSSALPELIDSLMHLEEGIVEVQ